MDEQSFIRRCMEYVEQSGLNAIPAEKALSAELAGQRIFDPPVMAAADTRDPLFETMKEDAVIGAHFMTPAEWLPSARSVVSFFFPFTAAIRRSNRADMAYPSGAWLNGRIEGQAFLNAFAAFTVDMLTQGGYAAIAPSMDARFFSLSGDDSRGTGHLYTSNWSERHAAYVCGLGTFGLSAGLITSKGVAGRFVSVITALTMTPTVRRYDRFDAYCVRCGRCARNCPANAIDKERGKNHAACARFLDAVRAANDPWYGCGKCQVGVPCECGVPGAR